MADNFNKEVDNWALMVTGVMLNRMSAYGILNSGRLFKSLNYKMRKGPDGDFSRISWTAPRYGFVIAQSGKNYTHSLSAGRGKTIRTGNRGPSGRPIVKYDKRKFSNKASDADWAFQTLSTQLPKLATVIAQIHKDRVVKAASIITIANSLRG